MSTRQQEAEDVQIELQPTGQGIATRLKRNISMSDVEGCCAPAKENKFAFSMGCILIILVVIILLIVLPLSFSYLDYNEMGLVRNKITSTVSLTRVYTNGRFLIGPSYEFKIFKADAHFETVHNIRVFTADKLEVGLSAWFQYFLRPDELNLLHQKYDLYYKDKVDRKANDAIKNVVTRFYTRDMVKQRPKLEKELFLGLKKILGGVCCTHECEKNRNTTECSGCTVRSNCTIQDYGMFVDVRYFQLGSIDIPDALDQSFLNALILKADGEREKHFQAAQIVRKETEEKVKSVENQASEILESAKSESKLITQTALANASFMVENARINGLKGLYETLQLNDTDQRNKFDYLRSLQKVDNLHLTIGFDQRISGSLPRN